MFFKAGEMLQSTVHTTLKVERLLPAARLPYKANPTDACYDLVSPSSCRVPPGSTQALDLGLALEMESGWEVQIRGRSGLAKQGRIVHPGTIDHLYRLSIKVLLHNLSDSEWVIAPGDRIAQMKVSKVWEVELTEAPVTPTERGGLGSTGR